MFYEPLGGGRYQSTVHTTGPWSPLTQHLGPPSALLVRALERLPSAAPMMIARVTVEILGPVPVAELTVTAEVDRPGRAVELLSGELSVDGRVAVRARAWRIVRSDTSAVAAGIDEPLPPPSEGRVMTRPEGWGAGYLDVMDWRTLTGSLGESGPATVWARQQVPLVGDEEPSGLQRVLTVADSGNGVSSLLDPRKWLFINSELTVHVYREPVGEWIALDAATAIGPEGIGTAVSVLHDLSGAVGRGAQALLIRPQ
ncbi:thioesterase family protein [Actinophytocola glycyrrhizae]|uniref:Thioesterase family protein n=1 Tax=Actinophytocola glycyrrhizae TaxID=2044873 RepID=A0ABV9RT73_9PSEU